LRSKILVTAVITAVLACVAPVSASHITVSAAAGAVPDTCPGTLTFTATIKAQRWGPTALRQVQYSWIRDDGGNSPTHTLRFPAGGSQTRTVRTTWSLGARHSGWEAIQITSPENMTSNHANFRFGCRYRS